MGKKVGKVVGIVAASAAIAGVATYVYSRCRKVQEFEPEDWYDDAFASGVHDGQEAIRKPSYIKAAIETFKDGIRPIVVRIEHKLEELIDDYF